MSQSAERDRRTYNGHSNVNDSDEDEAGSNKKVKFNDKQQEESSPPSRKRTYVTPELGLHLTLLDLRRRRK